MDYIIVKFSESELIKTIDNCAIGDSVEITRSTFDKECINYNQFLFNKKAAYLKCDMLLEFHKPDRMKITFVERVVWNTKNYPILKIGLKDLAKLNKQGQDVFSVPAPYGSFIDYSDTGGCEVTAGCDFANENADSTVFIKEEGATKIYKPKPKTLSLAKGNKIKDYLGFEGIITKYSSNQQIEITYEDNQKRVLTKDQIKEKLD
jgi:hypothetical protein